MKVDRDGDRCPFVNDDVKGPGKLFLRELFPPNPEEVIPAGDAPDLEVPVVIRQGKVRGLKDNDVGEHLRMDVAELSVDARPLEGVASSLLFDPGSEVVPLAVRGEDIVFE